MDFKTDLARRQQEVNLALEQRVIGSDCFVSEPTRPQIHATAGHSLAKGLSTAPTGKVDRALRLALGHALSGGKRLRPYLLLSVAELLGNEPSDYIGAACAVECVHTSSLLFDDLPCMDDEPTRRGKLSAHNQFGEATAILLAVSLLAKGFELLADNASTLAAPAEAANRAVICLAQAAGISGMSAGQMTELHARAGSVDLETIETANLRKTSVLFAAATGLPAILSGADQHDIDVLRDYSINLGLAYQIVDDILDLEDAPNTHPDLERPEAARTEEGSSLESAMRLRPTPPEERPTIASMLGAERAFLKAKEHISIALRAVEGYGPAAEPLRQLSHFILSRGR